MGNWTVDATPRRVAAKANKHPLDWTKLEQHLQEIGTLHTSIYRLAHNLAPAAVLGAYWFYKHPGLMFQGSAWWYIPRVSLLEIAMLAAVTLITRTVTGHGHRRKEELLHKEVRSEERRVGKECVG